MWLWLAHEICVFKMSNEAGIDVKDLLVVSKKRKAKMTPEEKVEKAERLAKERNERSNAKRRKPNLTYGNFSGSSSGPAVRKPWTRKSNLVVPAVVLIEEADHSTSAAGEESSIVNNGSSNFVVEEAELSVPSAGNEGSVVTPELNNCVPKESELPMSSAAEEASAVLEKLRKQQEQPKQSKESLFHAWKSKQQTIYGSLIDSYTFNQNVCGVCKSICVNGIVKCKDCCKYLCWECDTNHHSCYPSHLRLYFKPDFTSKSLLPTEFIDCKGIVRERRVHVPLFPPPTCPECNGQNTSCVLGSSKICYVVTRKGRLNLSLPIFRCENCEKSTNPTVEDYIASGFWPGTPERFSVLFHSDVMQFWHHLEL